MTVPSADELAYEKFLFDKRMAMIELRLKRIEARRLARESAQSRWTNPIMVAIIGAVCVGLGNAYVNRLNFKSQSDIAAQISTANGDIESRKSERNSVLEVLKGDEPDRVLGKLCVLLKLNQIPSEQTNAAVLAYLKANRGCDPAPSVLDPFLAGTASHPASAAPASAHPASAAGGGVPASGPVGATSPPAASGAARSVEGTWISTSLTVPGCGVSGCYLSYNVCGTVPPNLRATGNIRSSTDSFSGWGDWLGAPLVTEGAVCRTYQQHSHNQTRVVSYQFEVVPK